jgi:deoxyribodipyrimidine photolyase-like uncharacterized protein
MFLSRAYASLFRAHNYMKKLKIAVKQAQHFTDPYRRKGHNTQDLFYSEAEFDDFVAAAKFRSKEEVVEVLKNAKTLLNSANRAVRMAEKNCKEIQNAFFAYSNAEFDKLESLSRTDIFE